MLSCQPEEVGGGRVFTEEAGLHSWRRGYSVGGGATAVAAVKLASSAMTVLGTQPENRVPDVAWTSTSLGPEQQNHQN